MQYLSYIQHWQDLNLALLFTQRPLTEVEGSDSLGASL